MNRKVRWAIIGCGLFLAALLTAWHDVVAEGQHLQVPGQYATIREAVTAAKPGAVINVADGVYEESLVLDKPLTLLGAGWNRVTIRGGPASRGGKPGILVVAPNVRIEEVTIQGFPIGIGVRGSVEIVKASIVENGVGVGVWDLAEARILGSSFSRNTVGIELWALGFGSIASTNLQSNGIGVKALRGSRLSIVGGLIRDNGIGVEVWDAAEATLAGASIVGNRGHGLWIWGVSVGAVLVERCSVSGNGGSGIRLGSLGHRPDSMRVVAIENVIRENGSCGIWVDRAGDIRVTGRKNKLSDNAPDDLCPSAPDYPWPLDFVEEEED